MKMKTIEDVYGKEMTGLLSEGLDWIGRYSRKARSRRMQHACNPAQAIIAAALHALARQDIDAFYRIHRAENLSYFQYPHMKSWLKDDHRFPNKVLVTCFLIMAWLVVAQRLSPKSPLVVAVTELEEKYAMNGIYAQAVASCVKQIWNVAQSNHKKAPKKNKISTKSCFEVIELTVPKLEVDMKHDLTRQVPLDKTDIIKILVKGGTGLKLSTISVKTLLQSAIERESFDTIDTIMKLNRGVKKYDKSELIDLAVRRKCIKMIRNILREGLDRHFLDEEGNAPLHVAAATNNLKMLVFLTNVGASVDQVNVSGLLPLHLAAEPGIISHLLEKGADVNAKTPMGDTALHLAVSNDNKEAVKALMRFGARANVINNSGFTPLLLALQSDNEGMVELLTKRAVVIEKFLHVGEPFRKSEAKERLDPVTEVPEKDEKNEELADYCTDSESTIADSSEILEVTLREEVVELDGPIHKATYEGRLGAVMDMWNTGVSIDVKGDGGYTHLQYPSKYEHLNIDQFLVQRGSDINLENNWNWNEEHTDYSTDSESFITDSAETLEGSSSVTIQEQFMELDRPIQKAASEGMLDAGYTPFQYGHLNLENNWNWNEVLTDYSTDSETTIADSSETLEVTLKEEAVDLNEPIQEAAYDPRMEIVEDMLDAGVPIEIEGDGGYTPIQYGHLNTFQSQVQSGADNDFGNNWSWNEDLTDYCTDSVSTMAGSSENFEESSSVTNQGQFVELDWPIHKAACAGCLEAVEAMLDAGVPIDIKGDGGYTPLQYAAKYGHLNIVQFLVQRGADINLGNDWNWTPLHHAAHYSRYEITKFLLEAGANTQIVDNVYFKTPLSWATYNNKIIQLFHYKGIYK